jgi:signal transduction histidine kinase
MDQIQPVLMNLIRNGPEALEGTNNPDSRVIVLSHCECFVAERCDYGPALTDPEKAFESFYTIQQNGSHIGLAISRSIVEAHGGALQPTARNGIFSRIPAVTGSQA